MTTLNFPERSSQQIAKDAIKHLDNAVPFDTTFLFQEPGCAAVGQGTDLAKSIEVAMEKRFNLWAASWLRPYLEDITNRTPGMDAPELMEVCRQLADCDYAALSRVESAARQAVTIAGRVPVTT